jgi:hypothetical protein
LLLEFEVVTQADDNRIVANNNPFVVHANACLFKVRE